VSGKRKLKLRNDLLQPMNSLTSQSVPSAVVHPGQLDYTWMLIFPLPPSVTASDQSRFEKLLHQQKLTALEAVQQAFSFADPVAVRLAMQQELRYMESHPEEPGSQDGSSAATVSLESPPPFPVMSKEASSSTWGRQQSAPGRLTHRGHHARSVRCRDRLDCAAQSSIELCIAFMEALGQSIEDVMQESPPSYMSTSLSSTSQTSAERNRGSGGQRSLEVLRFASKEKDAFFICVRCRAEAIERMADLTEYPVQLSHAGIEKLGIRLTDPCTTPAYVKYDAFFRHLCREHEDRFNVGGGKTILRHIDRVRILYDQITQYMDIPKLQSVGLLADCIPLHQPSGLIPLRESWGNFGMIFSLWQPLDQIRNYFGEEIGFYFVFLQELTTTSLVIGIVAVLLLTLRVAMPDLMTEKHDTIRIFLSAAIMIWYTAFLKHWERRQALAANRWGADAHVASTIKALPNRRFHGQLMESPENQHDKTLQVPDWLQLAGRALAAVLSVGFIVLLVGFVALEYYFFLQLQAHATSPVVLKLLDSALGTLSGLQLKVVDNIWERISDLITDLEHRALQTDYDWSRCVKTSVVRFINSVIAPLYWSFIGPLYDPRIGQESSVTKTTRLAGHLNGMFFIRFVVLEAVNDTLKPLAHARMHGAMKSNGEDPMFTEYQTKLDSYESADLFNDFLDVLMPLGYVVLFGCVDSLLVLQLIAVLLIQVRSDAWKLTHVYRRPYPTCAEGIGFFNTMLVFLRRFMVASNLGLLFIDFGGLTQFLPWAFDNQDHLDNARLPSGRKLNMGHLVDILLCLASAMVLLSLMDLFDFLIPRTSFFVLLERRRQDLQRYRLFYSGSSEGLQLRKVAFAAEKLRSRVDFSRLTPLSSSSTSAKVRTAFPSLAQGSHLFSR